MMKMRTLLNTAAGILALTVCGLTACASNTGAAAGRLSRTGGAAMQLFSKMPVVFDPSIVPDGYNETDGIIRLGNGRIALKKLDLPAYTRDVSVKLKLTLVSNGDPWDKTGSCFVIPKDSPINLLSIAKDERTYPAVDEAALEHFVGIVPAEDYKPTVELLRFITPFGVGHFSKQSSEKIAKMKPVYIEEWADSVTWEQDITDLYPLLANGAYIGVYIDTWTKEGYLVDAELTITESPIKEDIMPIRHVEPLINTVFYLGQHIPDIFARKTVTIPFELPKGAKNVALKYIVTGHGGHEGGDEFTKRENIISLDGKELYRFTPWRQDCASFRRFNPSSGVWLEPRTARYISETGWAEKEIEEPIASSDLSRSNWCPGSDVYPVKIPLDIKAGKHTVSIAIPQAQASSGEKYNHWLVSAYLVWEME